MRVTVPDNIADITVEQFQKYMKLIERTELTPLEMERRSISIMANIPYHKVKNIEQKDIDALTVHIERAVNTDAKFEHIITLNKKEYGFEPNLDSISGGHNADLIDYYKDPEKAHNFLACLYRPITNKDAFGNYEIEPYSGTSDTADIMLEAPLNAYKGANLFFLNLAVDLGVLTQKYTRKERQRETPQPSIL